MIYDQADRYPCHSPWLHHGRCGTVGALLPLLVHAVNPLLLHLLHHLLLLLLVVHDEVRLLDRGGGAKSRQGKSWKGMPSGNVEYI